MSDPSKMSIEEILAACRKGTGEASPAKGADTPAADEASTAVPPASAPEGQGMEKRPAPTSTPSAGKKPGEMSVAEILAAARGGASGSSSASEPAKPAPAKPSAAPKDPSKMNVADILAAARGEKGAAPAAPAAKGAAAPKGAPAKGDAPVKKSATAAGSAVPPDTSSILVAARKGAKPGPMTKEQAAKQASATRSAAPIVAPPMPEKPAYARPRPKPVVAAEAGEPRRTFLSVLFGSFLAVGFTCLATVTGLWTLGFARFMFPNILTEPPSRFKVGFPGDFAPDTVSTRFTSQFGVWIVNTVYEGQRQIVALKTVCTHLGCTPNWLESERKFKCPCHGSGFYIDGINFEGPAPRPLERYAIRISDDGQIEVDKSRKFQQEMGQWSNSASFVSV